MRLDRQDLVESSAGVMSAIALGQPLGPALEGIARSSGSHSACLWRSTPSDFSFVGSRSFVEGMARLGRPGDEPWSADAVVESRLDEGFICNSDPRMFPKLRRLGFYQDVMCPNDFQWYAGLNLGTRRGATTYLAIWRSDAEGRIDPDDVSTLDVVARDLRIGYAFADRLATMEEERNAAPFGDRGDALFRLDAFGVTTTANVAAQRLVESGALRLVAGRLSTSLGAETEAICRMAAVATSRPGVPGATVVMCPSTGRRWQLLALPIQGNALDVFGATRALVAVIDLDAPVALDPRTKRFLKDGFRLTERETSVAGLIARGLAPIEVATTLRIGRGTVRNHLKSAMHKIGISSQTQLAALVARYG